MVLNYKLVKGDMKLYRTDIFPAAHPSKYGSKVLILLPGILSTVVPSNKVSVIFAEKFIEH
jgi:hypothetical protein